MKFIDEVRIQVEAGHGGRGCMSFRREKYIPRGAPDGGDGGHGGDVIAAADPEFTTLLDLRYQRLYRAGRGVHGKGSDQHGRRGEEKIIQVPVGTIIRDAATGEVLADLSRPGERVVVARRGEGLGHKFLRHVSRTSVLIHLLDASQIGDEDPLADWRAINRELELFDPALAAKPQIAVANKIDLPEARAKVEILKEKFAAISVPFHAISAATHEGLRELVFTLARKVEEKKKDEGDRAAAGV